MPFVYSLMFHGVVNMLEVNLIGLGNIQNHLLLLLRLLHAHDEVPSKKKHNTISKINDHPKLSLHL